MSITLDESLKKRVNDALGQLNKPYNFADFVFNVAATLHHETGERAYMSGYHPKSESPSFTLVETGEMTIGLFMEEAEMEVFDNTLLSLKDGYIHLTKK